MLNRFFDTSKINSLANKFRRKRFRIFLELIKNISKPVNILDIGGTETFWKMMEFHDPGQIKVTIINTEKINITLPNFKFIQQDARDLSGFRENEFDLVFSNSVIEHLGNYEDQKNLAGEIIRIGKKYFIQTPNYYFPVEPHFMFPMFQFLPKPLKIMLLTNFNLGWHKKCINKADALNLINSIRLLKMNEILSLFPDSNIYKEKFLFLTKSFILYK